MLSCGFGMARRQILVGGFVEGSGIHKSGQTVLVRYNSNECSEK